MEIDLKNMLLEEFGKKKKERVKKSKATGQTEKATIAELRRNVQETAENMLRTHWRAIARVYHITDHICLKCSNAQSVVNATLIRHRNAQGAIWERHRDDPLPDLPEIIVAETANVAECPRCLSARIFNREVIPTTKKNHSGDVPLETEPTFDFNLSEIAEDVPALPSSY